MVGPGKHGGSTTPPCVEEGQSIDVVKAIGAAIIVLGSLRVRWVMLGLALGWAMLGACLSGSDDVGARHATRSADSSS